MKKAANNVVVDAFLAGKDCYSHAGHLRSRDNVLCSYDDEIARRLPDGTALIRSQEEARSATSSAHINKVIMRTIPIKQGARVRYGQLHRWGVSLDEIESAQEKDNFECSLLLKDGTCLYRPPSRGIPFIRQFEILRSYRVYELDTWWKFDSAPISSWHAIRSALGDFAWEQVQLHGAYMFGHHLFIPRGNRPAGTELTESSITAGSHTLRFRSDVKKNLGAPPLSIESARTGGRLTFDSDPFRCFEYSQMLEACLSFDEQVALRSPVPLIKDWL